MACLPAASFASTAVWSAACSISDLAASAASFTANLALALSASESLALPSIA